MPDTLATLVRAKYPGAYDDMDDVSLESAVRAKYPGAYDDIPSANAPKPADRGVSVPGDTFAEKIAGVARGFAKSAVHSVADVVDLGSRAGVIPGTVPGMPNAASEAARAATAYRNPNRFDLSDPENQGAGLETAAELAAPVMEAGKLALAGGRALAPMLSKVPVGKVAADLATDAIPFGRTARNLIGPTVRKVLGGILDTVMEKAAPKVETVAAKASASIPATFSSTATLPETVPAMGGFSMPLSAPRAVPVAAAGRVVPAQTPTLSQALTDSLASMRAEPSMPTVTTPPEPSLPAGYTPRATVPKPKPVKMAAPTAAPAAPPKRAYFLKSEADLAPATSPAPSGTVDPSALPTSWQQHIGQDLFPLTGKDGAEVADALAAELKERGLSVGQAMMAVSKNADIPVQFRQQILKSLSRVNMKGGQ